MPVRIGSWEATISTGRRYSTIEDPSLIRTDEDDPITDQAFAVAWLIRGCGRGCGMTIDDYGLKSSSAWRRAPVSFLTEHGYKGVNWHTFREKYVRTMVWERKRAVYVCGEGNGGKAKHAWVADGWMYRRRAKYSRYPFGEVRLSSYERQLFMHCNFGWGGQADGYYHIGIFNTQAGPELYEPGEEEAKNYSESNYDTSLKIITYTEVY